ncbi:MAG: T9SS type A sorting domain-containing protein [Chitinophagaceae bacterium]|nr:T9SS type A sorting domain-containing protein [Chitinophagaceae bacterium]
MRKHYATLLLFPFLICFLSDTHAQGIYQFWGITDFGGFNEQGTIFSTRFDGTGHRAREPFQMITPGEHPGNNSPAVYNNKMYGVMADPKVQSYSFIYEYNPATNQLLRKINIAEILNFDALHDNDAGFTFVLLNNKFYGVAEFGGSNHEGCLFEYNPANHQVKKLYDFTYATGRFPRCGLTVYNNKLYGLATGGGNFNAGTLFEFDPATNTYSKKFDFNEALHGKWPRTTLALYNGKLFGATSIGTGATLGGCIFWFDPANSTFSKRVDLSSIGAGAIYHGMTVFNNKLYGLTVIGGTYNKGILFEFDHTTSTLTKKIDMSEAGSSGSGTLAIWNNKLYGNSFSGGANGRGAVYEYDPAANILTPRAAFNDLNGAGGTGYLTLYNNRLYGFTINGGIYNTGVLFEFNPASNSYVKKLDIGSSTTGYQPTGHLNYYQRKFYGTTCKGGQYGSGVIYSYDPYTQQYTVLHNFNAPEGEPFIHGGMVLYNNKFYGVTMNGGTNNFGVLYEFDPATKAYTVKVNFSFPTGASPCGRLSVLGSKLYGTTLSGGTWNKGTIFEFEPATNSYTPRFYFPAAYGSPRAGMTLYGGKFWGTGNFEETYERGFIFSWIPGTNAITREYDLKNTDGKEPGGLVVLNNELWGLTYDNNLLPGEINGHLFSFDPATKIMTTRHEFDIQTTGALPLSTPAIMNGKIYGLTVNGGSYQYGGTLFEYDPANNKTTAKVNFTGLNGRQPRYTQLTTAPALVSPGHAGVCWNASEVITVNNTNNSQWIPFTDSEGQAIAEINPNGNNLGNISVRFYTHSGDTRKDPAGRAYLDRNITITVTNQPTSPVTVRLYILKSELDKLITTPGSGVNGLTNLSVFKSGDACTNAIIQNAEKISSTSSNWENDYVFTTTVNSFSTFYFASSSFAALPINLETFTGTVKPNGNLLTWKASCTGASTFTIERSTDGLPFTPIGTVQAAQQDCNHPFQFTDPDISPATFYYRLKMEEQGSPASYSKIVMLNRGGAKFLQLAIAPNPVSGNTATLRTNASSSQQVLISIHDVAGRKVWQQTIQVQAGAGTVPLSIGHLGTGLYILQYQEGEKMVPVRFVKR